MPDSGVPAGHGADRQRRRGRSVRKLRDSRGRRGVNGDTIRSRGPRLRERHCDCGACRRALSIGITDWSGSGAIRKCWLRRRA